MRSFVALASTIMDFFTTTTKYLFFFVFAIIALPSAVAAFSLFLGFAVMGFSIAVAAFSFLFSVAILAIFSGIPIAMDPAVLVCVLMSCLLGQLTKASGQHTPPVNGGLFCGNFAPANALDIRTMNNNDVYLNPEIVPVHPNGECTRATCLNGSGIYVCNDGDTYAEPTMEWIMSLAGYIADHGCCQGSSHKYPLYSLSGQLFDDDNKLNVVIAVANCDYPPSVKPVWYVNKDPNTAVCN